MKKPTFPTVMKATALISAALTVITALLQWRFPSAFLLSSAITAGTICYHFSMRLLIGWIVPLVAGCGPDPHGWWFQPHCFEPWLYRKLRVQRWKDKVPTYRPSSFSLAHNSPEEIVRQMCISELVHEVIVLFSFLPILFSLLWDSLGVFLITSVLAACVDGIFITLQRYNRPRFLRLMDRKKRFVPSQTTK